MAKAKKFVFQRGEDPLVILERETPDVLSLESVLRETASLTGNVQVEPYVGSVYHAAYRMSASSNDWSIPHSKKDHICESCQIIITEGEQYVRQQTGVAWDSAKRLCVSCAARYFLNICEAHRFSAPQIGFGWATHWSTVKQEWIRLEANGRTCYIWQPAQQIPNDTKMLLKEEVDRTVHVVESKNLPGFDPGQHIPWLASLINAAFTDSLLENDEQIWAVKTALFFAQSDGISRWAEIITGRNFSEMIHCIGCGREISRNHIFRIYGEEDDYLCLHCTAKTILTDRTQWAIGYQAAEPYFWNQKWHGMPQNELENRLRDVHRREEMRLEYQKKIDQGITINEIADQEGRKPATICCNSQDFL